MEQDFFLAGLSCLLSLSLGCINCRSDLAMLWCFLSWLFGWFWDIWDSDAGFCPQGSPWYELQGGLQIVVTYAELECAWERLSYELRLVATNAMLWLLCKRYGPSQD